jgi:methyl-accepting chemotaxis protein
MNRADPSPRGLDPNRDGRGAVPSHPAGATLARRVSITIAATLIASLGLYAGITTIIEGRRFDAAVEKDLLLLDAVVTAARGRLSDAFQLGDATFLRERIRRTAGEIPGVVVARAYDGEGRLTASLRPVPDGDPMRTLNLQGASRGVSRLHDEDVAWLTRPVHLRTALGSGQGPLLGHILLGTSQAKNSEARWTSTAVLIVVGALALGAMVLAVQLVVSRALLRPVRTLSDGSRQVARGDLTQRFGETGADEIRALGQTLNAMVADLASMIRAVREDASRVDAECQRISDSAAVVVNDSLAQRELLTSAENASQFVERLLRDTVDSIRSLSTMSDGVTLSAAELQVAVREIARSAEDLQESGQAVARAASEEVEAIRQSNAAVTQLTVFVSESTELARHMDETLRNVETTVRKSLDLSVTVAGQADRGLEAVERVRAGTGEIRNAFNVTGEGIERLRGHSAQIGEIVRVIDGVTKQVNLLSLNASLLAGRGGEHGQTLNVVATEIRELAERTSASASRIASLVGRFETDLEFCVQSMRAGREAVENGESLSAEALGVLSVILQSSQESASIVQAITDATERHVAEGKRIVELMADVRERVSRLSRLTTQQAEDSHRILDTAQHMAGATRDVLRAAGAQSRGGQLIAQTMERAREIAREATNIAGEQHRVMERLAEVMRSFEDLTGRNVERAQEMSVAVRDLQEAAGALTKEVHKFSL